MRKPQSASARYKNRLMAPLILKNINLNVTDKVHHLKSESMQDLSIDSHHNHHKGLKWTGHLITGPTTWRAIPKKSDSPPRKDKLSPILKVDRPRPDSKLAIELSAAPLNMQVKG